MELFTTQWWWALLVIVVIDLVLAGDNAVVIALAVRNLPKPLKTRALVWGMVGAIAVRSLMTPDSRTRRSSTPAKDTLRSVA